MQDGDGIEAVREIRNPKWMIGANIASTFHGRDILAPAGAHLARGDEWTTAGPVVSVASLVRLNQKAGTTDPAGLHGK